MSSSGPVCADTCLVVSQVPAKGGSMVVPVGQWHRQHEPARHPDIVSAGHGASRGSKRPPST